MSEVKRPPYAENTVCAEWGCRHPLSAHDEGRRNPYPWLGPEWPTGCGTSLGVGDAGYETCSCPSFVPPIFVTFEGAVDEPARVIETTMHRRHWRDSTTGRWVIPSHGEAPPGHRCAQKDIYALVEEVNAKYGCDVRVVLEFPSKIRP